MVWICLTKLLNHLQTALNQRQTYSFYLFIFQYSAWRGENHLQLKLRIKKMSVCNSSEQSCTYELNADVKSSYKTTSGFVREL